MMAAMSVADRPVTPAVDMPDVCDCHANDDEWPGITGHGDTQDEAMRDLQRQIAAEIARRERVG
jgi:hypothetical protein